jgi:UDP:flavonoid glycosyltransferase YjiC (YdhE family)
LDQFFWGWRVVELGVGPAPIPRRELSADRLAATIHTATSDRGIRTRATTLGTDIRNENGLTTAVAIIERYMSEAHLPVAGSSST